MDYATNRDELIELLKKHAAGTRLTGSCCTEIADLLAADYLTQETLLALVAARDSIKRGGCGCSTLDSIIARLTPPPVVEWTDVGDGAIAACGGWTLVVSDACEKEDGDGWFAYHISRRGHGRHAVGRYKDRAEAKSAAESKLAELMRGT